MNGLSCLLEVNLDHNAYPLHPQPLQRFRDFKYNSLCTFFWNQSALHWSRLSLWANLEFRLASSSKVFRGASFKAMRGSKAYGLAKSTSSHILTYFVPFNFHLATRVKHQDRNEKETDIVRFVLSGNTSLASLVPRRALLTRCPRGEKTPSQINIAKIPLILAKFYPWSHFTRPSQ